MQPRYKKIILILLDTVLFAYVVAAMVSFNKPDESKKVCSEVNIEIADQNANGFLTAAEVKKILTDNRMYPLKDKMTNIKPRQIEDLLCQSPFVNTAECYKTQNNHVYISITQRLPVIRIKSEKGDDYYIDDKGGIMPNSKYTSDLIIATGNISKSYAKSYIAPVANVIMANDLWKNLIEQINVLPDLGIEIVPRVGNHIVYIGSLPMTKNIRKRQALIEDFISRKLTRLVKFYKYGLSQVGWNKYPYISLEFDNQIICKRANKGNEKSVEIPSAQAQTPSENQGSTTEQKANPDVKSENVKPKEVDAAKEKEKKKDKKEKAESQTEKNKTAASKALPRNTTTSSKNKKEKADKNTGNASKAKSKN